MLLKAYEETRAAPDALAAAEMALLRLAHAASLPPPEAAARLLAEAALAPGGSTGGGASGSSGGSGGGSGGGQTTAAPRPAPVAGGRARDPESVDHAPSARLKVVGGDESFDDGYQPYEAQPSYEPPPQSDDDDELALDPVARVAPVKRSPRTWAEVIALALDNRDLNLKWALERHARPVRVEPGQVVFQPTADADPGLAAALSRQLRAWTGETWFVSADAGAKGAETAAEAKAREAAQARAEAMADPLVAEALALWPGAEIADIRQIARPDAPSGVDASNKEGKP
jgi:DNA polymerase-3 subunit gamma/tau